MTTLVKTKIAPKHAAPNGKPEVVSYNPAWDVALQYFNQNPQDDIGAIQAVFDSMPPGATLTLLATIIGAIYADTYWTGIQMSPAHLSASLQQAQGWSPADCDRAAQNAFSSWHGMLARANFGSVGEIPKSGALTASPDALCNTAGALTPTQLLTMWNSTFFQQPVVGKNFCYGRAQSVNIPLPIQQPQLQMFITDAGFNSPPSSWIKLFTFGSKSVTAPMQGTQAGPVTAGGRAANGIAAQGKDAFIFEPAGAGHYCLLAVVSTEFFTNNPLEQIGNWSSQTWISYNGAAGWCNLNVQSDNEAVLKFYNQDGRAEMFAFEAHCVNVPAGTMVSLTSTDASLADEITSGSVKVISDYQVVGTEGVVPANYAGDLAVRIDTPGGGLLPAGASVEVRMLWVLEHGHTYYAPATERLGAYREASLGQTLRVPMGDFTFVGPSE